MLRLSCCHPCRVQAVLRGITVGAGVVARATARAVERFARRKAVCSLTGGVTVSDILMYKTMTVESLPRPREPAAAPDLALERAVVGVLGGTVVFVGAVIVVCHIADEVKQRSYWWRRQDDECTLNAGAVAAWLEAWEASWLKS